MGKKHLGEGQVSKKARQRMLQQLGKAMYKAGGRAGRKPIPVNQVPNLDNYRHVVRGMRRRLAPVDPRKVHRS